MLEAPAELLADTGKRVQRHPIETVVNVHEAEEDDMPQFGSPFSELANGRKLTDEELVLSLIHI